MANEISLNKLVIGKRITSIYNYICVLLLNKLRSAQHPATFGHVEFLMKNDVMCNLI